MPDPIVLRSITPQCCPTAWLSLSGAAASSLVAGIVPFWMLWPSIWLAA